MFPAGDLEVFIKAIRSACSHQFFDRGQVEPEMLATEREYLSPELMAKKFLVAYETALAI